MMQMWPTLKPNSEGSVSPLREAGPWLNKPEAKDSGGGLRLMRIVFNQPLASGD